MSQDPDFDLDLDFLAYLSEFEPSNPILEEIKENYNCYNLPSPSIANLSDQLKTNPDIPFVPSSNNQKPVLASILQPKINRKERRKLFIKNAIENKKHKTFGSQIPSNSIQKRIGPQIPSNSIQKRLGPQIPSNSIQKRLGPQITSKNIQQRLGPRIPYSTIQERLDLEIQQLPQ